MLVKMFLVKHGRLSPRDVLAWNRLCRIPGPEGRTRDAPVQRGGVLLLHLSRRRRQLFNSRHWYISNHI